MNNFLVVANPEKDFGLAVTKEIEKYLKDAGKVCHIIDNFDLVGRCNIPEDAIEAADCILVLGGDGTLLRVAGESCHFDTPLFGINLGNVGFLAEGETSNLKEVLSQIINGDYTIQERMMINGTITKDGAQTYSKGALNDVVISRAGFSRLIKLKVYVGGKLLDTYEADGVVVSTPTGSTGYNLSAGGPIVSPEAKLLVITPVSPHSLTAKSIVLSAEEHITIEIDKLKKTQDNEAIVSFDGGDDMALSAGDRVDICLSDKNTKLITASTMNFYEILRNKLGGSN